MKDQQPIFRILIDGTKDFWATSIDHFVESDVSVDDLWSACSTRLEKLISWLKEVSPPRAELVKQYRDAIIIDPMLLRHIIIVGSMPESVKKEYKADGEGDKTTPSDDGKTDIFEEEIGGYGNSSSSRTLKPICLSDVKMAFKDVQSAELYIGNRMSESMKMNARRGMAIQSDEEILAIYNTSLMFSRGDTGFAITPQGMHMRKWPNFKPQFALWSQIKSIEANQNGCVFAHLRQEDGKCVDGVFDLNDKDAPYEKWISAIKRVCEIATKNYDEGGGV